MLWAAPKLAAVASGQSARHIGALPRQSRVVAPEPPFTRARELSLSAMQFFACRLVARVRNPRGWGRKPRRRDDMFTTTAAFAEGPVKFAGSQLEPIKWSELAGWTADDHLAAFAAYQASCQALRKRRTDDRGQISGALSNVCRKAVDLQPQDAIPLAPSSSRIFSPFASRVWARPRDF